MKSILPYLGVIVVASNLLAGCHDGKNNNGANNPAPAYTISGTVSGLTGTGLVLSNNSVSLPVAADGSFSFAENLDAGASYDVTVATQPSAPAQTCTVTNGSGVANANVSNVAVTCVTVTYTISGSVSGVAGTGLVLSNGGVNLSIAADGDFSFVDPVNAGASYDVTVATQPSAPAQVCSVANGSGVASADVSNVAVTCVITPISITSSTPADAATNVLRTVVPTVTFSAALDGASVPGHVTFKRGTHAVAATVASSTDTITVTPQIPLSLLTSYTVATDTGLAGSLGEPMAGNASLSFTTRDGVWHASEIAKVNAPNTSAVEVAFTSDGNAMATWYETNGAHTNVWANIYVVGTGWGTPQQLQSANTSDELHPEIATDGQGHAVVVWSQFDGVRADIWFNRYTVGTGWSGATQLSSSNVGNTNDSPHVAMNATGDAVFAWVNNTNNDYSVWARNLPATNVLGAAARIESATGATGDVKVAMDAAGNATALWLNYDSINNTVDLWANHYIAGSWGAGETVENSLESLSEYALALDGAGNALAAWTQQIGNSSQGVYASRFDAGAGWSAAATLATTTNSAAYYPQVAADADGNAMIVWGQYDGSTLNTYSSYAAAGGVWGAPVLTGMDITGKVAFDASGNALAVWQAEVSQSNRVIKASRFTVAAGWSSATVLTPGTSTYAQYPQFAIDSFGGAVAAWIDYDFLSNTSNVASSRFDDTPVVQ